jgi:hypothetical protein
VERDKRRDWNESSKVGRWPMRARHLGAPLVALEVGHLRPPRMQCISVYTVIPKATHQPCFLTTHK